MTDITIALRPIFCATGFELNFPIDLTDAILKDPNGSQTSEATGYFSRAIEVGRGSDCTVTLTDEPKHAIFSRRHFRLVCQAPFPSSESISAEYMRQCIHTDQAHFFIQDLESMNGTFVNGVRLQSNARAPIHAGDKIGFGSRNGIKMKVEYIFAVDGASTNCVVDPMGQDGKVQRISRNVESELNTEQRTNILPAVPLTLSDGTSSGHDLKEKLYYCNTSIWKNRNIQKKELFSTPAVSLTNTYSKALEAGATRATGLADKKFDVEKNSERTRDLSTDRRSEDIENKKVEVKNRLKNALKVASSVVRPRALFQSPPESFDQVDSFPYEIDASSNQKVTPGKVKARSDSFPSVVNGEAPIVSSAANGTDVHVSPYKHPASVTFDGTAHAESSVMRNSNVHSEMRISKYQKNHLKSHQVQALTFLWKRLILEKQRGAILAHYMGLGKTFTAISFLDRACAQLPPHRGLILAPQQVLPIWKQEMDRWGGDKFGRYAFAPHFVEDVSPTARSRMERIEEGLQHLLRRKNGVLGMSFASLLALYSFKNNAEKKLKAFSKARKDEISIETMSESYRDALQPSQIPSDEYFDQNRLAQRLGSAKNISRVKDTDGYARLCEGIRWVIVDEATMLESRSTRLYSAISALRKAKFIFLLGNPQPAKTQLETLLSLTTFGDVPHTRQGRFSGHGSQAVHPTLDIRTIEILEKHLPPVKNYALFIRISSLQRELYNGFIRQGDPQREEPTHLKSRETDEKSRIILHALLSKICAHTDLMLDYAIDQNSSTSICKAIPLNGRKGKRKLPQLTFDVVKEDKSRRTQPNTWMKTLLDASYVRCNLHHNPKAVILLNAIKASILQGRKCVVFSQFEEVLTILETLLSLTPLPGISRTCTYETNTAAEKLKNGVNFINLSALSANTNLRNGIVELYNDTTSALKVVLLTYRTGSLGYSLVATSDVYLYDATWNSQMEKSAIARVYRYGQKNCVNVFRLISQNTIEADLFARSELRTTHSAWLGHITDILGEMKSSEPLSIPSPSSDNGVDWEAVRQLDPVLNFLSKKEHHISAVKECKVRSDR